MSTDLRIGVVGAGMMGAGHARMLAREVPGASVVAIHDADAERARSVAAEVGAEAVADVATLVDRCSAVVVASPDPTHAAVVSRCLEAGLPVLCEKPLAPTAAESAALLAQEEALGRRLVQVGFMRRYDPGLVDLRDAVRRGDLGEVRLVHCVHRNASSATSTTDDTLVTGSMIHELDQVRWLLDDEIASVEIVSPVAGGFRDPQVGVVRMRSGVVVTTEVFVNAGYGYDVRCEVVGTRGTASAAARPSLRTLREGHDAAVVPPDFLARFGEAYRRQLSDWVAAAGEGTARGAGTRDGHLANLAAAAGVASLARGGPVPVAEPG